jgi:hypothetical protein
MKLTDIIIVILFLLSLAVGAWYIFGNSPTFEQAILIFSLTALFTMTIKIVQLGSDFTHFTKKFERLEDSFIKLANDFKESKSRGKK